MAQQYEVTSVGGNPAKDRAHRMRMYLLAMSLRVLCVVSLFWVRGWWILLVGIGAVVLPYIAVLIGNAVAHDPGANHETPTPLELGSSEATFQHEHTSPKAEPIIIVDSLENNDSTTAREQEGEP